MCGQHAEGAGSSGHSCVCGREPCHGSTLTAILAQSAGVPEVAQLESGRVEAGGVGVDQIVRLDVPVDDGRAEGVQVGERARETAEHHPPAPHPKHTTQ